MAEQEQDRSEPASAFKLREAQKRGNVAKSMDLQSVLVIAALLACLHLWAAGAAHQQALLSRVLFLQAGSFVFTDSQAWQWLGAAVMHTLLPLLPFFAAVMIAGVLSSLLQHGPVFSTQPIKPDLKRINPVAGFKRLLSKRALFDTAKNLLKLALLAWMMFLTLRDLLPGLVQMMFHDPHAYGGRVLQQLGGLVFKLLLILVAVALLDLLFTRWEYADKLRMSRREVKDEHKQREGDPKVKARIRELQRELRARTQSLRNVPGSDVLVTNPTHIAVALVYRHGQMTAPAVVAKGAGELVEKMKVLARRHGVPIVENRRLARALYELNLQQPVPEADYAEVARVLVWVQLARRGAGASGAAA